MSISISVPDFSEHQNTSMTSLPVQISYAIGVARPLSMYIDTYGTGSKSNAELHDIIEKNFDLRPGVIIK